MNDDQTLLIDAAELAAQLHHYTVIDYRFELGHTGAGADKYLQGHIPGASYLHLEKDLSVPVGRHGGRHPLPPACDYVNMVDIRGLRLAMGRGVLLVDSREEGRYLGLEEPIDPGAGHIPGALNFPW